jgi:LysM repeat protein
MLVDMFQFTTISILPGKERYQIMKRFTLLAVLLSLLFACERKQESASSAPASPPASQPSAPPAPSAASAGQSKNAAVAPAPQPAKPGSGPTSGSSSGSSGTYTVAAGDTLSGIARDHGVSRDDLARWNKIQDPNRIHPGQTLRLSEQ